MRGALYRFSKYCISGIICKSISHQWKYQRMANDKNAMALYVKVVENYRSLRRTFRDLENLVRTNLERGFPLRCFQRLSLPINATRQCHWRSGSRERKRTPWV